MVRCEWPSRYDLSLLNAGVQASEVGSFVLPTPLELTTGRYVIMWPLVGWSTGGVQICIMHIAEMKMGESAWPNRIQSTRRQDDNQNPPLAVHTPPESYIQKLAIWLYLDCTLYKATYSTRRVLLSACLPKVLYKPIWTKSRFLHA